MNIIEHFVLPFIVLGFTVSAGKSLWTAYEFNRTARHVSATITGKRSESMEKDSSVRPVISIPNNNRSFTVIDVEASDLSVGDKIDVYISEKLGQACKHKWVIIWWHPVMLTTFSLILILVYIRVLTK